MFQWESDSYVLYGLDERGKAELRGFLEGVKKGKGGRVVGFGWSQERLKHKDVLRIRT